MVSSVALIYMDLFLDSMGNRVFGVLIIQRQVIEPPGNVLGGFYYAENKMEVQHERQKSLDTFSSAKYYRLKKRIGPIF